jgi:hypothetical protein
VKGRIRTANDLLRQYDVLNKRYFNGALPTPDIIDFKKLKAKDAELDPEAETVFDFANNLSLIISEKFRGHNSIILMLMLHEMCHISKGRAHGSHAGDDHGYSFGAEIFRLISLGAYDGIL